MPYSFIQEIDLKAKRVENYNNVLVFNKDKNLISLPNKNKIIHYNDIFSNLEFFDTLSKLDGEKSYFSPYSEFFQKTIKVLENKYIFVNFDEIKNFLINNVDIISILLEAPYHIESIFGKVLLNLELHKDYEENWEGLFIIIKTNLEPEKALELENELFEKWFVNIIDKVSTRLNFTEESL